MESLLEFSENEADLRKSPRFKLVPWISWDEWVYVKNSLFSSSPHSIASGRERIATWRSRGRLPVLVEATESIIDIQQHDPYFRSDLGGRAVVSDGMLSNSYCTSIIRFVNCSIEKTRKKNKTSVAQEAESYRIPQMLVDIRHEGSHRGLPSLQLLRDASMKALDWLKSYYWDRQKQNIPGTAIVKKNIRKGLQNLLFYLKAKKATRLEISTTKGTRSKRLRHLCGPGKFLHFLAVKNIPTKSSGLKRRVTKSSKHVLQLYFSHSDEVVDVLVEILLKSSQSSGVAESLCQQGGGDHAPSLLDEWKPVIMKLSDGIPEILLSLVYAILDKIEAEKDSTVDTDERHLTAENKAKCTNIKLLASLHNWLVRILRSTAAEAKDSCKVKISKHTVANLLHRSLMAASYGNNQLMDSALLLVHMLENKSLNFKLEKFLSLTKLDHDFSEACSFESGSENLLSLENNVTDQSVKSKDLIRLCQSRGKTSESRDDHVENISRWVVEKSWISCPVGMLPHAFRSTGRLPVLDYNTGGTEVLNLVNGNREWPEEGIEECRLQDDTNVLSEEDINGHLMMDGVWKKLTEGELLALASDIRILV